MILHAYCVHFVHIPISAGKRVEHRICMDLTFSRMNKNVGDSISVTPMQMIIVLTNDPICNNFCYYLFELYTVQIKFEDFNSNIKKSVIHTTN